MYCSPERAATTERTAATENHERFTYTLPSETEVELRYECRHDDGDTEMHEIYERLDTMSPLLPPRGGLHRGLQGVRSLHQPHNLAARAAEYIVFSAVQDAALQLMTQVPAWSREQLPPTAAVLCRGLQNKPQSTASSTSGTPPPHLARCCQVCREDGPAEAREARGQRLQEGPRPDQDPDPGAVQQV